MRLISRMWKGTTWRGAEEEEVTMEEASVEEEVVVPVPVPVPVVDSMCRRPVTRTT